MRIVCVAGARPNFMKIKPVVDALDARGADTLLVHTGQHFDAAMSDVFFDELGLRAPDRYLGVGSGTHAETTARVLVGIEGLLEEWPADVVVVVGDVNSTVAAALSAAKAGALVAHVEAGLRSRDWTMPEEVNRVVTDRISDYLLAPSADAVANLKAEGYRDDQIHLVGNVMIDTLLANVERAKQRSIIDAVGVDPGRFGLVTLHRPANVDDPQMLRTLVDTLGEISEELPLVFPVHPRTRARLAEMALAPGIALVEPQGYLDFIALEASARVVLTDSGGVQEETSALGVACITLRDNTERPITVELGTNVVVGRDPQRIRDEVRRAIGHGAQPASEIPGWDGHAGERIAEVLLAGGGPAGHLRPTDR
ncbi:MAG TPA: UDP-N-acetylglucosamine 2-epimerase (non-hydrolyzing) [Acidimicrobiales bacterium]|nr:UDP-N-acetylglucosamine 2-epimerase (non-hydrolyzing) [Acidimicrobiales bacterium]